jgi:putative ABC transport system substrate-binding protein
MKRRTFIVGLGAAAWPLLARAQQLAVPVIGFVGANASAWVPWTAAFVERLRALGRIEGRNVAIDYRWSEGLTERIVEIAAECISDIRARILATA